MHFNGRRRRVCRALFKMSNEVLFVLWIGDRAILTTLNNLTNFCKYSTMLGVCGQLITMHVCTCWRRVHQYFYACLFKMCNFGEVL